MIFKIFRKNDLILLKDESYENNVNDLKSFFKNKDSEITISLVDEDLVNSKGENYVYDSTYSGALELMLNDLKNESSCLFNILYSVFPNLNLVDEKVKAAKYLLEKFISCLFYENNRMNRDDFTRYTSYYSGMCYFKYSIPNKLIDDIKINDSDVIDLTKLAADQLMDYVTPLYYYDISYPDRSHIRNNKEKMDMLTICWLDRAKFGLLD